MTFQLALYVLLFSYVIDNSDIVFAQCPSMLVKQIVPPLMTKDLTSIKWNFNGYIEKDGKRYPFYNRYLPSARDTVSMDVAVERKGCSKADRRSVRARVWTDEK